MHKNIENLHDLFPGTKTPIFDHVEADVVCKGGGESYKASTPAACAHLCGGKSELFSIGGGRCKCETEVDNFECKEKVKKLGYNLYEILEVPGRLDPHVLYFLFIFTSFQF